MQKISNISQDLKAIQHFALIAIVLLSLKSLLPIIINLFGRITPDFHGPGYTDSIEYWSALQIWLSGHNPYDDVQMLAPQRLVRTESDVLMMWNPPIIFALLYPFKWTGNFVQFAQFWFLGSIAAYVAGFFCLVKCFVPADKRDFRLWLLFFSFAPFIYTLSFGQLSAWLFLGVALVLTGIEKNRPWAIGIGGILISLKPHLFIIFILLALVLLLKEKKYHLASMLVLTPSALAILMEIVSGGSILSDWLSVMLGFSVLKNAVAPGQWITASIPSVLSNVIFETTHLESALIALFSQTLSLIACLFLLKRWEPAEALSLTLLISLPLGSFAWPFDYTILSVSLIVFWGFISRTDRSLNLNLLTLLVLCVSFSMISMLHHALLPLMFFIGGVLITLPKKLNSPSTDR